MGQEIFDKLPMHRIRSFLKINLHEASWRNASPRIFPNNVMKYKYIKEDLPIFHKRPLILMDKVWKYSF